MQAEGFHQCLAYLVDIFGSINEVNTKMQGRGRKVLNVTDSINAFKDKLKLWVERQATGNVRVSFTVLHSVVDKKGPSASLLTDIKHHLNSLIAVFERYFSKLDPTTEQLMSLTRDPFRRNVYEIPEQLQEEFYINRALLGSGPKIVSQHKPGRFQDAHAICFHISLRVSIFSNANHKEQI
ncbi:protein FAM200C-like [Watersipora subatra]|uniref:protein FAM200C-like n=1 Tax=Watersipora subatra TaxID=2589382 RepID=UPI00355BB054